MSPATIPTPSRRRAPGALLLLALLAGCMERPEIPSYDASAAAADRFVSVSGTGSLTVEPNFVTFDVLVEASSPKSRTAWLKGADQVAALKQVLEDAGVRRQDMSTRETTLALEDQYVMRQIVSMGVRDLVAFPEILEAAEAGGAARIDNIRFGFVNATTLEQRAREKALAVASAKANTLAEEMQQRLGDVLNITEDPDEVVLFGEWPTPYEISVTVHVTYALSDW